MTTTEIIIVALVLTMAFIAIIFFIKEQVRSIRPKQDKSTSEIADEFKHKKDLQDVDKYNRNGFINGVYCYYRNLLSSEEKIAYDIILSAIKNGKKDAIIHSNNNFKPSKERVFEIYKCVMRDHPELFRYLGQASFVETSLSTYRISPFEYYADAEMKQKKVDDFIKRYIKHLSGKSNSEKIESVYNYLRKKTYYNDFAFDKIYTEPQAYDLYGCLIEGYAVCSGISKAAKYIFDHCGIKSYIVSGYLKNHKVSHAWLKVFTSGEWKYIDITFDLGKGEPKFFLVDEQTLRKKRLWLEDDHLYKTFKELKEKCEALGIYDDFDD